MFINKLQELLDFKKNNIGKISENIFFLPPYHRTDRPILAAVTGSKATLVVDAGNSEQHAALFLTKIRKYLRSPLTYLTITHWHWDHIFGMNAMGLESFASYATVEKIKGLQFLEWDAAALEERVRLGTEVPFVSEKIRQIIKQGNRIHIKVPDKAFRNKEVINLGDFTCELHHVGGDHADDSSIVYVPETKVLFLGDCLFADIYRKNWCYTLEKFQPLADKLLNFDARLFVASHSGILHRVQLEIFLSTLLEIGKLVNRFPADAEKVANEFKRLTNRNITGDILKHIWYFMNGIPEKGSEL